MIRLLAASSLALLLVMTGCTSADPAPNDHGTGGTSGSGGAHNSSGGAGGSGTGGGGTGGAADTGGGVGTGGDAGSSGGSDDASSTDDAGEGEMDASMSGDASPSDAGAKGDADLGGATLAGKPWIRICEKSWSHEQCCDFLCASLVRNCSDSPLDQAGIAACPTKCPSLTDMLLRCHVYHAWESLNPNVTKDHVSHCGHASGRVGGGGCPTEVYQ
jgi:hypothetical protein